MAREIRAQSIFFRHEVPFNVLLTRYDSVDSPDVLGKIAADDADFDPQVYLVFEQILRERAQGYDPIAIWPLFLEEYDQLELGRFSDQSLLFHIATILSNMGYE